MSYLCGRSAWQLRATVSTSTVRSALHGSHPPSCRPALPRGSRTITVGQVTRAPDTNDSATSHPPRQTHAQIKNTDNAPPEGSGTVRIQGLVRSVRKQKKVAFAHIGDGSTVEPVQAILTPEQAKNILRGAYVDLVGEWKESPTAGQTHELLVKQLVHIGETNTDDDPIQPKVMSADFLRSIPHMRMRTSQQNLILRTRSHLAKCTQEHFEKRNAVQVYPPLITSSDCEGAGEVFTLAPQQSDVGSLSIEDKKETSHFFGEPKYLTVSSQLHLEALSAELGDVWALSPTFRAEQSDTTRHLAEFYMLEAEYRGAYSLDAIIQEAEDLITSLARDLANSGLAEQHRHQHSVNVKRQPSNNVAEGEAPTDPEQRWEKLLSGPWPRISYRDAIHELMGRESHGHHTFTVSPSLEKGLSLEHERYLVSEVFGNQKPVIVTHYPAAQKPFYMSLTPPLKVPDAAASDDGPWQTVECFDILLPDGYAEVCGGSLREHRLDKLIEQMRHRAMLQASANTTEAAGSANPPASSGEKNSKQESPLYPGLRPGESLGALKWYADLRRFGSSPHGGFGIGWDRLLAYLCGVSNVRDVVAFPRAWGRGDC